MPVQPRRQIVIERGATCAALSAATRFLTHPAASPPNNSVNCIPGAFVLEPDDYIGTRLRLRVISVTNATAPVSDYTMGLYPIAAGTVAGGAAVVSITLPTVLAQTQVTITQPGIGSIIRAESPEFDWPAAGLYIIGIVSGTTAQANSCVQINAYLEAR